MNACPSDNAAVVSAVAAAAAAQCNSEEDLALMAAIFTIISDFMAAILAQRALFQAEEQQKQNQQGQQGSEKQSKDAAP